MNQLSREMHASDHAGLGGNTVLGGLLPRLYWGGVAAALGYCLVSAEEREILVQILAAILVLIAAAPLYVYLKYPERRASIPVFALNMMYYAIAFGLVVFFTFERKFEGYRNPERLQFALCLVIGGLISQWIGYQLMASRIVFRGLAKDSAIQLTPAELRVIGWVFTVGALVALSFVDVLRIPTFGQLIRLFSLAGPSILFYQALQRKLSMAEVALFAASTFYLVWQGFLTGSFAEGLRFGLILSLVALVSKRFYIFIFLASLFGGMLFVINPIKMEYRSRTWFLTESYSLNSIERSEILVDCVVRHWSSTREDASFISENKGTIDRLNQMGLFLAVLSKTPSSVPYWNGDTILDIFPSLIPRVLWPGKPIKRLGNEFGHRYGLLHHRDNSTSLNLPWTVELYANFGALGILTGMFVIGIAFGYIENVVLLKSSGTGTEILLIGLFAPLSFPESNLSLLWGGIVLGWIAILLTVKIFGAFDLFQQRRIARRLSRGNRTK